MPQNLRMKLVNDGWPVLLQVSLSKVWSGNLALCFGQDSHRELKEAFSAASQSVQAFYNKDPFLV